MLKNLIYLNIPRIAFNSTYSLQRGLATISLVAQSEETEYKSQKIDKQNKAKLSYISFFCKCGAKLSSFEKFTNHIQEHGVKNINYKKLLGDYEGKERGIKFYWGLTCSCGHKFTSSLCNSDLKVKNNEIKIEKVYRLKCSRCQKYANFNNKEKMEGFLKQKVKQRFIYHFYKENFSKFEDNIVREKELEHHRSDLCEKCKLSPTGDCRD